MFLGRVVSALFWILISLCYRTSFSCNIQDCVNDFSYSTPNDVPNQTWPYCKGLHTYQLCMEKQSGQCNGVVLYHAALSSVEKSFQENDCDEILRLGPPEGYISPVKKERSDGCGYVSDSPRRSHCGLFGDPHLKTFNGSFMTCVVAGAWPLLSSPQFAIQVTNELVGPNLRATATTKVTVLIKGLPNCGSAKTYEASDGNLPKAFVDGTSFSGKKERPFAKVVEEDAGSHVVINIRSADAAVHIRRLGRYFSIFVTLPEEIVDTFSEEDLQLCVNGCQESERLSDPLLTPKRALSMSETEALLLCQERNLTDFFLDSCVFDLMTSGDLAFREAAAYTLKDMWQNTPEDTSNVLKNCTNYPCVLGTSQGHVHYEKHGLWKHFIIFINTIAVRYLCH